jgi:arylsulfatase A-like enzyme
MGAACAGELGPTAAVVTTRSASSPKPNIVLVVVDDLDVSTTGELPRIPDLLASRGVSFSRAYTAQAVCAPSRASILTGQYTHNHGVRYNAGSGQGFAAFRALEQQTIATWLRAAGYRTSLVGKYLNDYPNGAGDDYVPPGWDDWYGHLSALEDGRYWNYWVNDNGSVSRHGSTPAEYSVDLEAARAVSFIRESAFRPEPLFLYLAPAAPHIPSNYPERFGAEFRYSLCPRGPSFNEIDVSDKPTTIRRLPMLTDRAIDWLDERQRWRLRSMRAVEEELAAVIEALRESGRLDNTYIVFTSDNGILLGQHRAVHSKNSGYEECILVPLFIRGPGLAVRTVTAPVQLVDLAPTLLELAGAPVPGSVDGRSLAPFLRGETPDSWRSDVVIENWELGPSYALRTPDWAYIHNDSEELELYDMRSDPWQLASLHRQADPAFLAQLERRIERHLACRGETCHE